MTFQKEKAAGGTRAAIVKRYNLNYIQKIKSGQTDSAYWLELKFEDSDHDSIYIPASNEARSLLLIYKAKNGLTRKEALEDHFILSLTQHVHWLRHKLDLDFWTERVGPRRYGRYHLMTPLKINVYRRRDS